MTFRRRKVYRVIKKITMVTLLFVLIYIGVSFFNFATFTGNDPWGKEAKCFNSKDHTARLIRLAHKTHLILDSMGIEHWLIYGSLWGPLRGIPGPLPWDNDIDFGMNGDGNFKKIPLEEFKARFTEAGLVVRDRMKESSSFAIEESLDLYAFYDYRGTMMQEGYGPWFLYINYRLYHSFPARFVQPPLPKARFGSFNISVPRGGMEIMKYLYPFNWWKTVKPASCENLNSDEEFK